MNEVEQFARLFRGRSDVIGKASGTPRVERRAVTLVDYEAHLAGDGVGIGIYPMLDDHTVWFAAIDLDEPNFELARTMQKLVPGQSWIERSKSGNAHVWVFFGAPTPAWAVRTLLRAATQSVGRPDVEVFPKQDGLREGMVGNFINLPYHGDERPMLDYDRMDNMGAPLTLQRFLSLVDYQTPEAWVRRARALGGQPPEEREPATAFGEQPILHMCAEYIVERRHDNPLKPGHRSVVLFNVARQFLNWRDCTEKEARRWVHELNDAGTSPAPKYEVDRQFDNALAGRFTGTGCDDPVMTPYVHPHCPIAKGEVGRA
jgi:hypothetical protein